MNKELQALKEARKFKHEKDKNLVVIDIDYFNQCLDGIEITLKEQQERIEELEETNHLMFLREHENTKKLKALEIIKSKEAISVLQDFRGDYFLAINNYGIEIAQEEYDLLKEVLTNE